jgi:nitrogen fixation/metabolism regulation signal transduction histidine kinase
VGRRLRYEDGVLVLILCAVGVPAVIALALTWTGDLDAKSKWTLTLAIVVGSGAFTAAALARAVRPVQTIGNLIAALRERDYAVRGRVGRKDDALGLALSELAQLAAELRDERHRDEEAAAGLARVVEGLDVAVLAIDRGGVARIANRAAERLLGRIDVIGADTGALGIAELLTGEVPRTVRLGAGGPWEVRRSEVRLSGVPHMLLVLTDVHRALRAEEREAWRRLVRVLGHEINNSLGPIRSIAETLRLALARTPRA